jgi:hypothetical protein
MNTHQADDHSDMRRDKHVGYGRYGHAASYCRAGDVEHEESIMVDKTRKYVCTDGAGDEGE